MLQRISVVDSLFIKSVLFSSTILIGDCQRLYGVSRALAVQREEELFFDEEAGFEYYEVFRQPIFLPPLDEEINLAFFHEKPVIHVGSIRIHGVSATGHVQVGSTADIRMESRIKHIRHLKERGEI